MRLKKCVDAVDLILPEQKKGKKTIFIGALGLFFRCLIAFVCAFGTLMFLADSISVPVGHGYILGVTLFLCAAFSAMVLSKPVSVVLGVVLASGGAYYLFLHNDPKATINAIFTACQNAWCLRLCELGYNYEYAVRDISESVLSSGRSVEELYAAGMFIMAVFICFTAVFFTVRRARLFPVLSVATVISTVILYFGAGRDLISFGIMVSSLLALAALSYYDSVFLSKRNVMAVLETDGNSPGARKELAKALRTAAGSGGYVGIAVLILALAVSVLPMQADRAMIDIPAISRPAARIEKYISALVNGYDPGDDGLLSIFGNNLDGHSTKAKTRTPSGKALLKVGADADVPIYLRTWTGTDYIDDNWYTVSYGRRDSFRDRFGENFSSEELFREMRCAIDPRLEGESADTYPTVNSPLGYITSRVSIKRLSALQNEVVLPTATIYGDGVMNYGTYEPHFISYNNYFDGVYTSRNFALSDRYTVNAEIALTPTRAFAYNISVVVKHYSEQYAVIKELRKMIENGANESEISAYYEKLEYKSPALSNAYESLDSSYGLPEKEMTLSYRYVYEMDAVEREEIHNLCDTLSEYNDYVYGNYVTLCENYESFSELMSQISQEQNINFRSEAATYVGRHRVVMTVIDYLADNMTYTLSPRVPNSERQYYNAADTFLFDTREGYCAQYATAAVMLLRSIGIPCRYVEGYIADGFLPSDDGDVSSYTCTVTDFQRHAWIEVYYDYYGWLHYEATEPYALLAETSPVPETGQDTTASRDDTQENSNDDTDDTEMLSAGTASSGGEFSSHTDERNNNRFATFAAPVIAIIIVLSVVATVILVLKARYTCFCNEMSKLLGLAARSDISPEQRLSAARRMNDIIMKLLEYHSLSPLPGETAGSFAARVDKSVQGFVGISIGRAMKAMQAGEFSNDISREELLSVLEYLNALYKASADRAGWMSALKLRCFLSGI